MATKADRIKSLELCIEEQRRDNDFAIHSYKETSSRCVTFIAAGLAVLVFLYGSVPNTAVTLKDKLFIPDEPYGVIIYILSLIAFLFALSVLVYALRARRWSTAYEINQPDGCDDDYEKYLVYVKKRYDAIGQINDSAYAKKQALLQISFLPLVMGGIILVLLRIFGG